MGMNTGGGGGVEGNRNFSNAKKETKNWSCLQVETKYRQKFHIDFCYLSITRVKSFARLVSSESIQTLLANLFANPHSSADYFLRHTRLWNHVSIEWMTNLWQSHGIFFFLFRDKIFKSRELYGTFCWVWHSVLSLWKYTKKGNDVESERRRMAANCENEVWNLITLKSFREACFDKQTNCFINRLYTIILHYYMRASLV